MDDICRGFVDGDWLRAGETIEHETSCSVLGAKTGGSSERLPGYTGFYQMSDSIGIRGQIVPAFRAGEVFG